MDFLPHAFPELLLQAADAAADAAASAEGQGWLEWIKSSGPAWITEYGAWFIFVAFIVCGVGLHISEDFLLIPAGIAIYEGHMTWGETILAAYFGLVIGDTLWIWVCRNYGTRLIHSKRFLRMMHPRKLLEAKHAMSERGVVVLILARFIPGTRTAVLTMTGLLHMPWWKFLAVELTTVAVTVPVQIGIGWLGKAGYDKAKDLGSALTFGLAGIAITVAVVVGYRWYRQSKGRKGPRPRAPAAWLRTFGRNSAKAASGAA